MLPSISDSFDLLCSNYLVHVGLNLIIVSIPVQTIGSPSPISPNWSQKNDQSGYRPNDRHQIREIIIKIFDTIYPMYKMNNHEHRNVRKVNTVLQNI